MYFENWCLCSLRPPNRFEVVGRPQPPSRGGRPMTCQNIAAPGDDESPEAAKILPIADDQKYQNHSPEASDSLARITREIDPAWLQHAQESLLAAIDLAGQTGATVAEAKELCPPAPVACWWCCIPRTLKDSIESVAAVRGPQSITHCGLLRRWIRRVQQ